jgi:hypothetical protein
MPAVPADIDFASLAAKAKADVAQEQEAVH